MKKKIFFFEVRGGTDKGPDGLRPDTMPMVNACIARGFDADVLFYEKEHHDAILAEVLEHGIAYVSRINPGNLTNEGSYFDLLRTLCANGIIGMPHPDAMIGYGAKDALVKLRDTDLVPSDTYSYYTMKQFKEQFPRTLAVNERVLKQNRGSTGEGIWRVQLVDQHLIHNDVVQADAMIKCTEAKDNHVEYHRLDTFMNFCEQYIIGENGMLVDMPFLPRIVEGEIRLLMLRDKPVNVVHKKPQQSADAFSATLFSGATYRYDSPAQWQSLIDQFLPFLSPIKERLGNYDLPLIWTADFILDRDEQGHDTYVLGEMNCSCVGFTSHLELAEDVADEIVQIIQESSTLPA